MSTSEHEMTDSDKKPNALHCALDVVATQHLQEDILNSGGLPNVSQNNASDADKKANASQSEIMSDEHCNFDVGGVVHVNKSPLVDAKPSVSEGMLDLSDQLMQQPRKNHSSDVHAELDVGDGTHQSQEATYHLQEKLNLECATPHPREKLFSEQRKLNASSRASSDVVQVAQRLQSDNDSHARRMGATRDPVSLARQSDVSKAVLDLVDATQRLQEDPANIESINFLISRLKYLLLQERQTYAFMRQNSVSRNKLESLHNLIQYLESQVQRLQKAAHRHGVKYYVANISNKVRGHEMGRIGQSMESELQSWLDQQSVREIANVISNGSQDAQVHSISSFESVVQKGYNSVLQETVLSAGLVEKLAGLLVPGVASWQVAKEAAFALSALIDFNKDIFLSLVLMAKTVENILRLMNGAPDEHVLMLVSVIKSMVSAGHTIVVEEIHAHNGVSKIVQLLDHKLPDLQHAAMDCVFELAYYGSVEVVNKMFEFEVVKKLALLQQADTPEGEHESIQCDKPAKQKRANSLELAASWLLPMTLTRMQDGDSTARNPFADAVTKFALHLSIGTGLRKREKRALKQEFLRQIKEVMEDDAEIANITAEVLWAP